VAEGTALDADAVRAFCQGRIAQYKIPRYIEFVDSLPMTISGKPQKFLMRAQMIERLKTASVAG
jgi:fatty-acyl-CoA synthase